MEVKKIKIFASYDWSMRLALTEFLKFLNPVITYKKKKYDIELGRIIAEPIKCGTSLNNEADFIIDRTIHWNTYYKCWAQQAVNSQMNIINHSNTFGNHDKHSTYDLMARAMHPKDRLPTTVLLPQYAPYTEDLKEQERWEYYQSLIIKYTKWGFDEKRKTTDWEKVNHDFNRAMKYEKKNQIMRDLFYCKGNYIKDAVEKFFDNKFPLYLKKAFGGGGSDVFKVNSIEELYQKYDETGGKVFHIQEAIENYDIFIRCMSIGPMILPMEFLPDKPLHEHYGPNKVHMDRDIYERLSTYSKFINAYHRWTYNSFEAIIRDGIVYPIDFANACPDSNLTSLHAHFPWVIVALAKWTTFCAVTEKKMRIDMEQDKYLDVLNDPKVSALQKFKHTQELADEYFDIAAFEDFCEKNFPDINEKMVDFYDAHIDKVIEQAIEYSDFPDEEKPHFRKRYRELMDTHFRENPEEYLTTVVYKDEPAPVKTAAKTPVKK